jgi:hypothetical protein
LLSVAYTLQYLLAVPCGGAVREALIVVHLVLTGLIVAIALAVEGYRERKAARRAVVVPSTPWMPPVDPTPPAVVPPVVDPTPTDDPTDPDHEPTLSSAPYDSDRCWGCARGCTRKGWTKAIGAAWSTADAVTAAVDLRYRAEYGRDRNLDAADADVGNWSDMLSPETEVDPIEIARRAGLAARRDWLAFAESCYSHVSDCVARGVDPWRSVVAADSRADECPF